MNFLDQITVLILTYNEAPNIGRTLEALAAFPEVVVLDSGSDDGTREIVARYRNARCVIRRFDNHAAQWTFGLSACRIARPWVLALDADYVLPRALCDEIARLQPDVATGGFRARFRYCIGGRPLRGTLYPPVIALFHRERTHYIQEGHTQRAVVEGAIGDLDNRIDHDDRKPLVRWLQSQQKYAALEARHLRDTPHAALTRTQRLRLMGWPAPILVFFYTLLWKGCLLDGWPGWLYVLQRTTAELMIALEIVDRRIVCSNLNNNKT